MAHDDTELYRLIQDLLASHAPFATAQIVRVSGSIPNELGARMLVDDRGQRLAGTVGGGRIEHDTLALAAEAIREGKSRLVSSKLTDREAGGIGMMCGGSADIFIDVHRPAPHLVLCGAGHINRQLFRMSEGLGYRVTVIDDRTEWASADNYPGATLIHARPEEALGGLELLPSSFVVVGTRDGDLHAIAAAAATRAGYIGVVASKRKAILLARELAALPEQPWTMDELLPRLYAPIGLHLGGRSPEAVALSILAEIQALRHGLSAGTMRLSPEDLACYIARKSPGS